MKPSNQILQKSVTAIVVIAGLLAAAVILSRPRELHTFAAPERRITSPPLPSVSPVTIAVLAAVTAADPTISQTSLSSINAPSVAVLTRLTFGSQWAWPSPTMPQLARFANWAARYIAASPEAKRSLIQEGVTLAQSRNVAFTDLIRRQPEQALARTVPLAVRSQLPAEVTALLEERVTGRGDLHLIGTTPRPGQAALAEATFRTAVINGRFYRAHVYGRREQQTTKIDISLAGVALNGELAVSESPVRLLEAGEVTSVSRPVVPTCPIMSFPDGAPAADVNASPQGNEHSLAIEVGGVVETPCCMTHLLATENRLVNAEDASGPYAGSLSTEAFAKADAKAAFSTTTGALYPTSWTEGAKKIMVILADFSDLPGTPLEYGYNGDVHLNTPITPEYLLSDFYGPGDPNNNCNAASNHNAFFITCSYGQTSLVLTTNDIVSVRMPQTAAYYAAGGDGSGNSAQLQTDAQEAAKAAGYDPGAYDRVVLIFSYLGNISGSQITYGGVGDIAGSEVWINGFVESLNHELGHTYGLQHANFYQTTDGTVTGPGTSIEYGDPTDSMDGTDQGQQYNMWSRNLLGWMPDAEVTTVTTSGYYRVYRFDAQSANTAASLALKIPGKIVGDSVHDYWIGLRESVPPDADSELYNSAYILWGYHYSQKSDLLNMNAKTSSDASDAALSIGQTFSENGITITLLDIGGSEPDQFMDVQISIDSSPGYPSFFTGQTALSDGVYYLAFPNSNYFGYYSFLTDPAYIYHFDLGYEYCFDANDGQSGVYFYDFASNTFFYTSPSFPFPYLYDFTLNAVLYYYPDVTNPGHYTTDPRYFFDFGSGLIITK